MMNQQKKEQTPQLENGHLCIANELVDQFQNLHLSGNEWMVLWVIIRKTWGWKKKQDAISLSVFSKLTGLSRVSCHEALKNLLLKMVIVVNNDNLISVYSINKHYSTWTVTRNGNSGKLLPKTVRTVTENGNEVLPKKGTKLLPKKGYTKEKKETITKETITKESNNEISLFIDLFKNVNPSYRRFFANKTERAAADRLLTQYGLERLSNLVAKLPDIISKPYAPVITSPYLLEVKMGALLAYMKKQSTTVNKYKVKKI
ncbi:MAG: hypothetical protein FMNOHCHN_03844 [Ignavibacteriaceae bacterium]|nr:hypothetical protein [Ignavibacteriaceae bacterium]